MWEHSKTTTALVTIAKADLWKAKKIKPAQVLELPPAYMRATGKKYIVVNGHHRIVACMRAGVMASVEVLNYTEEAQRPYLYLAWRHLCVHLLKQLLEKWRLAMEKAGNLMIHVDGKLMQRYYDGEYSQLQECIDDVENVIKELEAAPRRSPQPSNGHPPCDAGEPLLNFG